MAWRPWYQPQLPQTMWGRLVAPQRGQMLRDGANTRQADARRIRVFDFDIFFFGTGMGVYLVLSSDACDHGDRQRKRRMLAAISP